MSEDRVSRWVTILRRKRFAVELQKLEQRIAKARGPVDGDEVVFEMGALEEAIKQVFGDDRLHGDALATVLRLLEALSRLYTFMPAQLVFTPMFVSKSVPIGLCVLNEMGHILARHMPDRVSGKESGLSRAQRGSLADSIARVHAHTIEALRGAQDICGIASYFFAVSFHIRVEITEDLYAIEDVCAMDGRESGRTFSEGGQFAVLALIASASLILDEDYDPVMKGQRDRMHRMLGLYIFSLHDLRRTLDSIAVNISEQTTLLKIAHMYLKTVEHETDLSRRARLRKILSVSTSQVDPCIDREDLEWIGAILHAFWLALSTGDDQSFAQIPHTVRLEVAHELLSVCRFLIDEPSGAYLEDVRDNGVAALLLGRGIWWARDDGVDEFGAAVAQLDTAHSLLEVHAAISASKEHRIKHTEAPTAGVLGAKRAEKRYRARLYAILPLLMPALDRLDADVPYRDENIQGWQTLAIDVGFDASPAKARCSWIVCPGSSDAKMACRGCSMPFCGKDCYKCAQTATL